VTFRRLEAPDGIGKVALDRVEEVHRIVQHDADPARIAREAYLRFGKDCHPVRLNCGDCGNYALAKHRRIKLLSKGDDFARTDIAPALPAT